MIEQKMNEIHETKSNYIKPTFKQFMIEHRVKKEDNKPTTHTRIGNGKDIYGGKYHIPDDELPLFYRLYANHINNGHKEYLTEVQHKDNKRPLLIDFDFRYDTTIKTRQHTGEHIEQIVQLYFDTISQCFDVANKKIYAYIFHKKNPNCLENKTKDGIHMVFNIALDTHSQCILRNKVAKELPHCIEGLKITNTIEDILDIGITKGSVNWQLFGSQKPDNEPYKLTNIFECVLDDTFDIDICEVNSSNYDILDVLTKCSARNTHYKSFEMLPDFQTEYKAYTEQNTRPIRQHTTKEFESSFDYQYLSCDADLKKVIKNMKCDNKEKYIDFIDALPISYSDNHSSWIACGWAIRCQSDIDGVDLFSLWIYFSRKSDKFDYMDVGYYHKQFTEEFKSYDDCKSFKNGGKTFATISNWLKNEDIIKFRELCDKHNIKPDIEELIENINHDSIARHFIKNNPDRFLYTDDRFYIYNGIFWKQDVSKLSCIVAEIINTEYISLLNNEFKHIKDKYNKLMNYKKTIPADNKFEMEITIREITHLKNKIKNFDVLIQKLRDVPFCNNIINKVKMISYKPDITLDDNKNLIAFNNGVYDLKEHKWIDPNPSQYISLTTGYDYKKSNEEQIKTLNTLFEQVFPDEKERQLYFCILASTLSGTPLDRFIIANGGGGNGKGVIHELLEDTLGNYFYVGSSSSLLAPIKNGSNPEIANMNKKRCTIFREPDESKALNISVIKELTGGKNINARQNYSNNTEVSLHSTCIIEMNEKLKMNGKANNAVVRRLIDIHFRSTFVSNPEEYHGDNVFKRDGYFKSDEFRNTYKFALFDILTDYWKQYGAIILKDIQPLIPQSVIDRTNDYIEENDELKTWFDEEYEKTEDDTDVVIIADMYNEFTASSIYTNMSKREKRQLNKKNFTKKVSENMFLKKFYKLRERRRDVVKKYGKSELSNVLVGFVKVDNYDTEKNEDELELTDDDLYNAVIQHE